MLQFAHTERDPLTGAMFSTNATMKFTEVTEREYISQKLNNGDWPYYLVMEVIDMWYATGDKTIPQYAVCINAVSVKAVEDDKLFDALESAGFLGKATNFKDDLKALKKRFGKHYNAAIHMELCRYGVHATLYTESGNDEAALVAEAQKQAVTINGLFGFYMDRAQNRLGSTGWDFIAGDVMAGLNRWKEQQAA